VKFQLSDFQISGHLRPTLSIQPGVIKPARTRGRYSKNKLFTGGGNNYKTYCNYPTPGLPSKASDMGFEPLIEVIRDTCGPHDAFGLACTSRYYENMGYFGHINCSDNFNAAIQPFDIEEHPGWMALNLFFNTGIDDTNAMFFDEPWLRPGDYVLFRALTDLVCPVYEISDSIACILFITLRNSESYRSVRCRVALDKKSKKPISWIAGSRNLSSSKGKDIPTT